MHTRSHTWRLVLGFLAFSLGMSLLWMLLAHAAPPACSHWAAPGGTGSACTESQPCQIGTWLSGPAGPGKTLCLKDGTYKGDGQMLQFSAKSGTADQPIWIRAVHDGAVAIDGQFGQRPLDCNASYIVVQGVNVRDGNDSTLVLRGSHCTVQRVVAYATKPADGAIENVCDIGGSFNLLEDGACIGYARKSAALGARGGNGPNTLRRVYVEFNGAPVGSAGGGPTNALEIGYGQSNVTAENVLVRRNVLSSASEPESPIMVFSTHGSALLGSIAFATASDSIEVNQMLYVVPDAGSQAGSGFVTSDTLIQDVALLVDQAHTHIKGMVVQGGSGSANNVLRRVIAVAPQGAGSCSGSGWECTDVHGGGTLSEATGGQSVYTLAPGLCTRYKDRVLTQEPLWPFPMTGRIQAAMQSARLPARNVTQDVARTFGEMPPQCVGGDTPIPPEPPTPTPGPHPVLQCTGTVTAVPGAVQMRCEPAP